MTVGADYSKPVLVNGYECWNCSQVANAKKGEDPAHPTTGPDATLNASPSPSSSAVKFGGALSGLNVAAAGSSPAPTSPGQPGSSVNVFA
jgi:hypothetical protein